MALPMNSKTLTIAPVGPENVAEGYSPPASGEQLMRPDLFNTSELQEILDYNDDDKKFWIGKFKKAHSTQNSQRLQWISFLDKCMKTEFDLVHSDVLKNIKKGHDDYMILIENEIETLKAINIDIANQNKESKRENTAFGQVRTTPLRNPILQKQKVDVNMDVDMDSAEQPVDSGLGLAEVDLPRLILDRLDVTYSEGAAYQIYRTRRMEFSFEQEDEEALQVILRKLNRKIAETVPGSLTKAHTEFGQLQVPDWGDDAQNVESENIQEPIPEEEQPHIEGGRGERKDWANGKPRPIIPEEVQSLQAQMGGPIGPLANLLSSGGERLDEFTQINKQILEVAQKAGLNGSEFQINAATCLAHKDIRLQMEGLYQALRTDPQDSDIQKQHRLLRDEAEKTVKLFEYPDSFIDAYCPRWETMMEQLKLGQLPAATERPGRYVVEFNALEAALYGTNGCFYQYCFSEDSEEYSTAKNGIERFNNEVRALADRYNTGASDVLHESVLLQCREKAQELTRARKDCENHPEDSVRLTQLKRLVESEGMKEVLIRELKDFIKEKELQKGKLTPAELQSKAYKLAESYHLGGPDGHLHAYLYSADPNDPTTECCEATLQIERFNYDIEMMCDAEGTEDHWSVGPTLLEVLTERAGRIIQLRKACFNDPNNPETIAALEKECMATHSELKFPGFASAICGDTPTFLEQCKARVEMDQEKTAKVASNLTTEGLVIPTAENDLTEFLPALIDDGRALYRELDKGEMVLKRVVGLKEHGRYIQALTTWKYKNMRNFAYQFVSASSIAAKVREFEEDGGLKVLHGDHKTLKDKKCNLGNVRVGGMATTYENPDKAYTRAVPNYIVLYLMDESEFWWFSKTSITKFFSKFLDAQIKAWLKGSGQSWSTTTVTHTHNLNLIYEDQGKPLLLKGRATRSRTKKAYFKEDLADTKREDEEAEVRLQEQEEQT
jgi:hypothetical protein